MPDELESQTCGGESETTVWRECRRCGWQLEVEKSYPEDETAVAEADCQLESHFRSEHRGRAKVRVVLEREVSVHPEQELSGILDDKYDSLDDDPPFGWAVALAYGEMLEEPNP